MPEYKPEVNKEGGVNMEKEKPKNHHHQRRSNNQEHGVLLQDQPVSPPITPFTGESL